MEQVTTRGPEETEALAARLVAELAHEAAGSGTSTIVALQGELGAGKTVFAKGAARALGVEEVVTSPTFVVEKIYELPEGGTWKRLVHIDAYRLAGEEELRTIGWNELATNPGNLVLIEWPEQVGLGVPERAVWVSFTHIGETARAITVERGV